MANRLTAAILVVSETAFQDASQDKCIEALQEIFHGEDCWDVTATKIVSDDVLAIQREVMQWTDRSDPINLVVTSGGTGFARKDVTPEAISPLLHKHAPGLVHGMISTSLNVTPFAMMARPLAGVRNSTIILTLPGSPKGARENLQAVIKLLPHACTQAAGANSRAQHSGGTARLEKEAGISSTSSAVSTSHSHGHHHHHHHGHGHNHSHGGHTVPIPHTDPSARPKSNDLLSGPSQRARQSPYPMLKVEEALALIAAKVPAPVVRTAPVNQELNGHVLAADVQAAEDVPAFRASIVDGYATACPQGKGVFPVAFASHAQAAQSRKLEGGEVARITTGAPLPDGADGVIMVEDTEVKKMTDDGREEVEIEIFTDQVKKGENVREIGSDVQKGTVVMKQGEAVSSVGGEFGLLASVGVQEVKVFAKPVIGVLSTGDEIVEHTKVPSGHLNLGEVRDTNRPTLLTCVQNAGYKAVDLGIVSDKANALESTLRESLKKIDVLITSGGVSMGELDLLKPTIERSLGGIIHFGRVSMKPGKPTTFATVPTRNIEDPTSGREGISTNRPDKLFVLPALHKMAGVSPLGLPKVAVKLETEVQCDKVRDEYHRVIVFVKPGQAGLWASSTGGQRSSRIGSFKGANALLELPPGGHKIGKGETVTALMMGPVVVLDDQAV